MKNTGEGNYKQANRFEDPNDLRRRFDEIKLKNPIKEARTKLIEAYDKLPTKNPRTKKLEPNHGKLAMKVDNQVSVFLDFLTESPERFKVNCLHADPLKKDEYARIISTNFRDIFFKSWENMFVEEAKAIFEMVMFSKGIMHWPEKIGYKSENVSVVDAYPNLSADMLSSSWELLFIRKSYTMVELYNMVFGDSAATNITKGWKKKAIESILENPKGTDTISGEGYLSKFNKGGITQSQCDEEIILLHCYVKEYNKDTKGNRISKYIIPEAAKFFPSESKKEAETNQYLFVDNSYCECISQVAVPRSSSVTRSYWDSPSFAELIYLACKIHDQASNAILRAVIRNMTLFLKSSNSDQADRLRVIGTSEVEVLDSDTELVQNQVRIPIQEATQMVRQIMFDVESELGSSQAIGSQNTKGYAITAKEAELKSLNEDKSIGTLIKSFTAIDRFWYKETYRRAIDHPSTEEKKISDLFKKRMEFHEVPPEVYAPKNVVIEPVFAFGGSRANKIQFAQSLYGAVSVNASSEAQKKAKRISIAAHVGEENADEFFNVSAETKNLFFHQQKAGGENEDMDNPLVNPANIPVAKDDNHMIELVFHIQDYEFKLGAAIKMLETANQMPIIVKMGMIMAAKDIITAQDAKGAHIEAHFQYIQQDPTANVEMVKQFYDKFSQLRKSQDDIQAKVDKQLEDYMKENQQDVTMTIEQQHLQAMNQMTQEHAKNMNDIGLAKAIEQKKLGAEKSLNKSGQDIAHKEQVNQIELDKKQLETDLEKQKLLLKEANKQIGK